MIRTNASADPGTRPRTSTVDRPTLMRRAAIEYDRLGAVLAGLGPGLDTTRRMRRLGRTDEPLLFPTGAESDMTSSVAATARTQVGRCRALCRVTRPSGRPALSGATGGRRTVCFSVDVSSVQ